MSRGARARPRESSRRLARCPAMHRSSLRLALQAAGLALLAACGGPGPWQPVAGARSDGGAAASIAARPPAASAAAATAPCALDWAELDAVAPPRIALAPVGTAPGDDCPPGFDPVALLAAGGCVAPGCTRADMGGRAAAFEIDGPGGSGRYAQLGVVVDGAVPRFACVTASTVAWRHLYPVADRLAPLPWFDDVDGDGAAELVAWQRLPWGSAEVSNGLVPIVYALDGDALVRRDDRARALAHRVADAYRALIAQPDARAHPQACFAAMARALDGFGS